MNTNEARIVQITLEIEELKTSRDMIDAEIAFHERTIEDLRKIRKEKTEEMTSLGSLRVLYARNALYNTPIEKEQKKGE